MSVFFLCEDITKPLLETVRSNNNNNNNNNNNHLTIIQKIPDQSTGNPRSQGATEKSHIGHCTHTAESTNVKVQ
jgi:hypothetical protein